MARKREDYVINETDRESLLKMLRSPKTAQSLARRAKIVLLTAEGLPASEVAAAVGTTTRAVYRWRRRFKDHGVSGLHDRPRPGQPQKLSEKVIKEVLRLSVHCIPDEATHWSVRLMAKATGRSPLRLTYWSKGEACFRPGPKRWTNTRFALVGFKSGPSGPRPRRK